MRLYNLTGPNSLSTVTLPTVVATERTLLGMASLVSGQMLGFGKLL